MDLLTYRKENNLTQDDVAGFMGFKSASAVHRHEQGLRYPTPENIEKYSKLTAGKVTNVDWLELRKRQKSGSTPNGKG